MEKNIMLEQLLHQFGYLFIFIGTLLEGELVMALGGYFAGQKILNIYGVILSGFLGIMLFDSIIFLLGHKKGEKVLGNFPHAKREKITRLIQKGDFFLIFFLRFLYGLRIVSLLTLGGAKVSKKKFFLLYPLACIIWSIGFGYGGLLFGKVFAHIAKKIELNFLFVLCAILGIYGARYFIKKYFYGKTI